MEQHIFNVNAIRDKSTLKPSYKSLAEYINKKEEKLKKAELEQLKTVVKSGYDDLINRIDKSIKRAKS